MLRGEPVTVNLEPVLDHDAMKKMREGSLTGLDLPYKGIGAHGAMVIAPLLEFSRSLNSVDLRNNGIPDAGKQQLRDAVKGKSITLQL